MKSEKEGYRKESLRGNIEWRKKIEEDEMKEYFMGEMKEKKEV